jgi:RND superfamily putative drug exporter
MLLSPSTTTGSWSAINTLKEAYDQGHTNDESVSEGIRLTAGQITSAAAIMVGVFGTFALGRTLDSQQFGLGLGVAVLIDATIIRSVLLPASMKLLGDWNWYLPRWLEWLPKVGAEASQPSTPEPVAQPTYGIVPDAGGASDD